MKRLKEQQEEDYTFFEALVDFGRKKIDGRELQELDSSNLLFRVNTNDPIGASELILGFDSDDQFLESLNVNEDDRWFASAVSSRYSSFEFMDSYQVEEDFKEGYIVFDDLDDDNTEMLKKIATVILKKPFDLSNDDYRRELSNRLLELFPKEIDYILNDYKYEKDAERAKAAKEAIEKEIKDVLEEKGFELVADYYKISTNLNNLLHLFMLNYDKMVNLKELITNLFKKTDIGGWYDNQYDFYDDKLFDSASFNREVYRQFNNIIDIMEEEGILDEYLKMYDRITSKFVIGKFYPLPHNKRYQFQIESIDYEDNKIKLILRDKENNRLARLPKLDEKGFMKFVYNPQLFGLKDFFD